MTDLPVHEHSTIEMLKTGLGRLGYTYESFALGTQLYIRFTSPAGKSWTTSEARINYPFICNSARQISKDKFLAYALAEKLGVAIPKTLRVAADTTEEEIAAMLEYAPLIVKPNSASLSNGLSLNLIDAQQVHEAIDYAGSFSTPVLVQQQVSGEEVRIVVLDGKATAAILRQTPRLTGDGTHTLEELLAIENESRSQLRMEYLTYPQLTDEVVGIGSLDMSQVFEEGEVVELGKSTMIKGGASMYDVLETIDPSYLRTAEKLAGFLGEGFVVVDLFIQRYSEPQTDDNYTFIEFNFSPVLKLFYSCRDGKHYDILPQLVTMIDRSLHGTGEARL